MTASIESGPEFEKRGLDIARALHDPLGTQGAVMFEGRERDGLFVDNNEIHAYEFTTSRAKEKAIKDGGKIVGILKHLGNRSDNSFKSRAGWFVTLEEPTADQRTAINDISRREGERVHAISIATLHKRVCDSEQYLRNRRQAPFGSVGLDDDAKTASLNVPVRLLSTDDSEYSLEDLSESLNEGQRALLVGNYGVGKSHILRELFKSKLKEHFKNGKLTAFPVHINLRDCAGLKTPAEILRRHAEEIGFNDPDGLISAWRAGACLLLLDGFDEIVPARWFGNVSDLKTVRWEALSPIRRLVEETPKGAGIIAAGRSHYFSGLTEMTESLGFKNYEVFSVPDFNDAQLQEFLSQAGVDWRIPDWVPMRPLLLGYLVQIDSTDASNVAGTARRATGWRSFLQAICEREARMFSAVRPNTIRRILSRVATLARSRTEIVGPIDMELLRSAFIDVNGYQPDEEGLQLLLRLPGLARDTDEKSESRVFVDRDLADTAYGLDLAEYMQSPYDETHPLTTAASWANASSELGIEVAAEELNESGAARSLAKAALASRNNQERFDAVTADTLRVASDVSEVGDKSGSTFHITGVMFEQLTLNDNDILAATTFQDCVISRLDISGLDEKSSAPHFRGVLIDFLDGASAVPPWLSSNMTDCEIGRFSAATMTTSGIMQLSIDRESRIALSILKKVFDQRGSGRKEGALSRGLDLTDREYVAGVVSELVSQGWITKSTSGKNIIYVGVKDRRAAALKALEAPADFKL